MRLLIYDTEMQTANAYLLRSIATAAGKLLGATNVYLCSHHDVVEYAASGDWDGLLAIGGAGADLHIIKVLNELPILRILWTTEDPYERRLIENVESAFHFVFTNEHNCDGCNSQTSFLPLAAEPDLHYRTLFESDDSYEFDLTFVGTAWPNRVASLDRILSFLEEDLNVFLCLPWNRHIPQPRLQTLGIIPQLRMDISDLCDIWNRSRVVLTIGREFSLARADEFQIPGVSPPPRIYETAMAGGFQIVLGGTHFQLPGRYADLIPSASDEIAVAELIKQYLANPEERIAAAIAAQKYTLEFHTYAKRLEAVIERFNDLHLEREKSLGSQVSISISHPQIPTSSDPVSVLHVAHNLIGLNRGGGTELYVDSLASWQGSTYPGRTVLALAPKDNDHLAVLSYKNGQPQLISTLKLGPITPFSSTNQKYEKAFCDIISNYQIGLVHFHHLKGLPLSLPIFARALGCRVVLTLHDFYMLCHRYTLLRPNDTFCEVHKYPDYRHLCNICLQASGIKADSRNRRLEITRRSMSSVDVVLGSTRSSIDIASKVFPDQADRFDILEMITPQIELLQYGRSFLPLVASSSGPLNIAVIGNTVRHKGITTLIELLGVSKELPLQFHIFGATDELDEFLENAELSSTEPPIKTYTYGYKRTTLINALRNMDVSLFLSTWPETYHISLGEAMYLGVVPIATDLGAHSDRIRHEENGLLVPPNDSKAVLNTLLKLHADRSLLNSLRNGAMAVRLMSIKEHCSKLETIYSDLKPRRFSSTMINELRLNTQLNLSSLGVRLGQNFWNDSSVTWDDPP